MGLDGVEIVMAVEDAFDIQIEDSEAARILTPRSLIDYVMNKVNTANSTICLTQSAFNLLRKSFIRHGDLKRSQLKPAAKLSALLPRRNRLELLWKITNELAIKKPPELVRPRWVNAALLGCSLASGIGAAAAVYSENYSLPVLAFVFVAIAVAGFGFRLTKPLCTEFPKGLQNLGGFARWVMAHKGDLAETTLCGWTREQVTARVREIIVDVLGCNPDFSEDARFIEDLGLS
jgi:acyl carrier protein